MTSLGCGRQVPNLEDLNRAAQLPAAHPHPSALTDCTKAWVSLGVRATHVRPIPPAPRALRRPLLPACSCLPCRRAPSPQHTQDHVRSPDDSQTATSTTQNVQVHSRWYETVPHCGPCLQTGRHPFCWGRGSRQPGHHTAHLLPTSSHRLAIKKYTFWPSVRPRSTRVRRSGATAAATPVAQGGHRATGKAGLGGQAPPATSRCHRPGQPPPSEAAVRQAPAGVCLTGFGLVGWFFWGGGGGKVGLFGFLWDGRKK